MRPAIRLAVPANLNDAAYPTSFRAWRLIALIFLASVVSAIDRGIFSLLVDPIKHDLAISDVQISLLQGLSFGLLYATAGLALGVGADRFPRRRLLAFGIFVWSLATILGGLATNFNELFLTRIFVGLGEATLGPVTFSLVADLFPPERRGRPSSICLMGQAVATGLSIVLTGIILSRLPNDIAIDFPVFGALVPWRVTFVICGLTGFVVVALLLVGKDPIRRGVKLGVRGGSRLLAAIAYLRRDARVFVPFYLSFAVVSAGYYGSAAWAAVFIMRKFELSAPATGHMLGIATMIAAAAGPLIAGNMVDIVSRRGGEGAKLKLLTVLPFLALPSVFAVFAPNVATAIVLLSVMTATFPMFSTTFLTAIQEMVPNDMRGVAVSVTGLTNTIIGSAGGPLVIALATEHLYKDPRLVGYSIITVTIPAVFIGAALSFLTVRNLRVSLARPGGLRDVMPAKSA